MRVRVTTFLIPALAVASLLALGVAAGQEPKRISYTYDAAGRLASAEYPGGKKITYTYDAAGNLLRMGKAPDVTLYAAVKKPAAGAWVIHLSGDTVSGFGADAVLGLFTLEGTLALGDGEATGELRLKAAGGATLATFTLEKSKVKRDKKTGDMVEVKLKSARSGPSGVLKATAESPSGGVAPFTGTFASSKNQVKVGKAREVVGAVTFAAEGERAAASTCSGAITGSLVRDAGGKAYGEVTHDGTTYVVYGKLKDGAKSVKAKTGKGAPVKFQMVLRP